MIEQRKERRDRLVALSLVSLLLMLIYGPAAAWFVAADRFLFDRLVSSIPNAALDHALIVSINPSKKSADELLDEYGDLIQSFKAHHVRRIILANPPPVEQGDELPGWAATLASGAPVFVPSGHRLSDVATENGIFTLAPDNDDILRRSVMWHLQGSIMSPSLPLAIALHDPEFAVDPRISRADVQMYLASYAPIPRLTAEEWRSSDADATELSGKTVLLDSDPALIAAAATLPSGQFVTYSEVAAALLADIEHQRTILAPSWIRALEWLTPALLAILAVLFLPGRKRREILLLALIAVTVLILVEALLLAVGRVRLDLGRPILIFLGVVILNWWLAGTTGKTSTHALKRGSDFLSAGRLEPAFAEFRRCDPTESLATVMYKLSLAFEAQAQPERAEAVLEWMNQSHGSAGSGEDPLKSSNGTPRRLGRYVIERKIGRGAMGAVYLARDPRINRPVALKVIPIEKEFEDEELAEARLRFFREAESAGRLTHPNIITVFDAGEDKHLAYIAMEYLPGTSLTQYTDPKKLLAPRRALELCARTADALDYAHDQQVIHRDIKPANLLYNTKDDSLKISDFGVARLTDNNRTKTGIVLGTPMYMSPEQLNAEPLTGHSDLFSLGVTLYELLTGEVPFKATNIAVLMTKITTEDPAPVSNRRAGVPPSVDAVLAKALAKRPQNRFANGGEFAIALRNCARYASS